MRCDSDHLQGIYRLILRSDDPRQVQHISWIKAVPQPVTGCTLLRTLMQPYQTSRTLMPGMQNPHQTVSYKV